MGPRTRLNDDRDDRGSRGRDDDRGSRRSRDDDDDRGGRVRGRDDDRGGRGRDRGDDRGGSRRSGYQYSARTREDVQKRAEQGGGDFDRYLKDAVKLFKPSDKENAIRFLPPTWDRATHYGHDIWVHFGVGPDRQTYLCLHKMKGEDCPICEERQQAVRDGDEKYAKELEPKRRVLVYLVDRNAEKEGVQAWAMPWTLDRDVCAVSTDRKSGEVLPIDHPDEGYDVLFDKRGAKDRTEYSGVSIDRRDSPLGKSEWLDFAVDHPLPDQLIFYDYDHIRKAFGGSGGSGPRRDRDDDHDDRRGARGNERRRDDDDDRRGSDRGRDRDDDKGRDRDAGRGKAPAYSWKEVHEMTGSELDSLVDELDLDLDPDDFDSDEELADEICKVAGIEEETRGRSRDDDRGGDRGKLGEMRRRREGGRD